MSFLKHATPRPILSRRDPGSPRRILFEFPPEDLSQGISSTWSETSSLGRNHPIQQFTKGDQETITFTARFFARHQFENVQDTINALKRAVKSDPSLGRPPIFDFVWGRAVNDTVVIQSVGGVKILSMRPDGTVRDASLTIALRHYEPYSLKQSDPNAKQQDTFYLKAAEGDSWESLAQRFYRSALKGDLLRRLRPDLPFLTTGTLVKMLKPERFDGIAITPSAIPLVRNGDGIALRIESFAARGASKKSVVVKR